MRGTAVDRCAIAYRTNKGLSTIDYAKNAFDFIMRQEDCIILVTDFRDFFENLDHEYLKSSLCDLLSCKMLPADYYAVFKNSTMYSYWEWKSLLEINHLDKHRGARKELNSKAIVLTRKEFLRHKAACIKKKGVRTISWTD